MSFGAGVGIGLTAVIAAVLIRVALWALTAPFQIVAMLLLSFCSALIGMHERVDDTPTNSIHELTEQFALQHHARALRGAA